MKQLLCLFLLLFPLSIFGTPVSENGWLSVRDSQIVNQHNIPIQLKGMSSHGLQWYGKFVNYNVIKELRDNWNLSVFRIALYLNEGGYLSRPELKYKVFEGVDAAIDLGVYVIVDWHILSEKDPNVLKHQAIAFFQELAQKYKDVPNVLWEIANEPNRTSWANNIRPYSIELYNKIREIDSSKLILIGTNNWSQGVDEAANYPLPSHFYNIVYTCHFYAGSHGQFLRDRINYAMRKGLAIFITEWGTTNYTGNGGNNYNEAANWMRYLADKKISWANWTISDHPESSAALNVGASANGGWSDRDLKETGRFVKYWMIN